MRKIKIALAVVLLAMAASVGQAAEKKAKKKIYRKVQNVSFDGEDINGVARHPMSSYLLQNKVMRFLPLYKVREKMNEDLVRSLESLR